MRSDDDLLSHIRQEAGVRRQRKQRAMVRKGIGNGLVSHVDDGVDRFFALYAGNVLRHGTPALPKRFFARLKEEVARRGAYRAIWVTETKCLGLCPRKGAAVAVYPQQQLRIEVDADEASALFAEAVDALGKGP